MREIIWKANKYCNDLEKCNIKTKVAFMFLFLVGCSTIFSEIVSVCVESYKDQGFEWMFVVSFMIFIIYDIRREEPFNDLFRKTMF